MIIRDTLHPSILIHLLEQQVPKKLAVVVDMFPEVLYGNIRTIILQSPERINERFIKYVVLAQHKATLDFFIMVRKKIGPHLPMRHILNLDEVINSFHQGLALPIVQSWSNYTLNLMAYNKKRFGPDLPLSQILDNHVALYLCTRIHADLLFMIVDPSWLHSKQTQYTPKPGPKL